MPRDETPFSVKRDELRGAACMPSAAGKDKQNDPSQPRSIRVCALAEQNIGAKRTCGISLHCWLRICRARRGPGTWHLARLRPGRQKQWASDPGVGRTVIHAESAARSSAWNINEVVIDPALISPSTPPPSWPHRRPRRPASSSPSPRTTSRHLCSPEPAKTLPATSRLVSASIARVRSGAPTLLGETAGLPC
jgi:hypothetical protein